MRPTETFIGQPIRSLQTMLRVLHLDDPRYLSVIPDGIYGNDTTRAVSIFQRENGIPVTGVTNQETWDAIVALYEDAIVRVDKADSIEILLDRGQVLIPGDRDPHIYLLQSMLTHLSDVYPQVARPTHTGVLDSATVNSLESFQRLTDLPVTGRADLLTWKHLNRQFTLSAQRRNKK